MRTDFDACRFSSLVAASGILLGLLFLRLDTLAHFGAFALVTVLLWYGTAGQAPFAVLGALVAFGALDEAQHLFVPGRTAELAHFIAAAAAAAAVTGLLSLRKEKPCVELSRRSPAATSSPS